MKGKVLARVSLMCDLTTTDVRSSLSKRLMAWSRDLYIAAEILWVIRRFRSMDRPSNCETQEEWLKEIEHNTEVKRNKEFQYLYVSLFEQRLVAVRRRVRNDHAVVFTLCSEAFV